MECNLQRLERKKKLFSWAKGRQSDLFETRILGEGNEKCD